MVRNVVLVKDMLMSKKFGYVLHVKYIAAIIVKMLKNILESWLKKG